MDDQVVDPKDEELPSGPIVLPKEEQTEPEASHETLEAAGDDQVTEEVVPAAAAVVVAPPPEDESRPLDNSIKGRVFRLLAEIKEEGTEWFKKHKLLGGILVLTTFGLLLYFWPLITCLLIGQHMIKNTKGTVNKDQMYKIVGILAIISLSVQALWIVQLAQAASLTP